MRSDDKSNDLAAIRESLASLERERSQLGEDDVTRRAQLRSEETELRARLIRLQDSALKNHDTEEIPGVPGGSPKPTR
jgi:hypothetical protein